MNTKLTALEALNLCCECSGIFYSKKLTVARAAIAALEADIANGVEPVGAESRFTESSAWLRCSVEHHNLVSAKPDEWPGYETRLLYTTPQEPAAAGWMPIETAPKDGVIDISTDSGRVPDCFWGKPTYGSEYGFVFNSGDDCDGPVVELVRWPLHWMYAPASPGGAA